MSHQDREPLDRLDGAAREVLAAIAGRLIPEAHGMPSAADVLDDERLHFVLDARPDLGEPLAAALRPELGADPEARLATLEREEPANLAALQLVVVGGYYTDAEVRRRIGYPGQEALRVEATLRPDYVEEGLIAGVMARGPVWRDPTTGTRAADAPPARDAERDGSTGRRPEGGDHGGDGS